MSEDRVYSCILYNGLSYKTSPAEAIYHDKTFTTTLDGISANLFEWIEIAALEKNIDELFNYIKSIGTSLTGYIIVVNKVGIDVTYTKYTFSAKEVRRKNDCTIKVTTINTSKESPQPKLTFDEKIALVEKYWSTYHRAPDGKEVYEGFKIGSFILKSIKDANTIAKLRGIMGDVI